MNTFHADASKSDLRKALAVLKEKNLTNERCNLMSVISSSPLILDNFVKVNSVNTQISQSTIYPNLQKLEEQQTGSYHN